MDVEASGNYYLALSTDGTVYGAGDNGYLQYTRLIIKEPNFNIVKVKELD